VLDAQTNITSTNLSPVTLVNVNTLPPIDTVAPFTDKASKSHPASAVIVITTVSPSSTIVIPSWSVCPPPPITSTSTLCCFFVVVLVVVVVVGAAVVNVVNVVNVVGASVVGASVVVVDAGDSIQSNSHTTFCTRSSANASRNNSSKLSLFILSPGMLPSIITLPHLKPPQSLLQLI
jgi:hypothetical protein